MIGEHSHDALRLQQLDRLDGGDFDVFVVGGGINGAVSAAALAASGLSVGLAEQGDFANFTSQESSNLVWGGFKYLQNYEILLVNKLLKSRNLLFKSYPTAIAELPFLATLDRTAPFPSWLAGLGSVGYWMLGRLATRRPRYFNADAINKLESIVDTSDATAAIEYADGYLKDNDARFVWNFIRSALDNGAAAANYVTVVGANHGAFSSGEATGTGNNGDTTGPWRIELRDELTGKLMRASAKTIVNGAGPFTDRLNRSMGVTSDHRIVYSKGIHLVVPQLNESERVLAFFDDTQRLFYVIPMAHRSVIGTTDTRTENAHEPVTDEDRQFLLSQINARLNLATPLTVDDIIAERSGVRPLVVPTAGDDKLETDWTALSRKHVIETDPARSVVTIFGGKLTDCLNVGTEVIEAVTELGLTPSDPGNDWYGEPSASRRKAFYQRAATVGLDRAPEVERAETVAEVLWRRHGMAAFDIVDAIESDPSLAEPVMVESDVLRGEIPLYLEREMVVNLDDLLRRRTKLALIHRNEKLTAEPAIADIDRQLLGV